MRRSNLRRSITAITLAAVMAVSVVPAISVSADTVRTSELDQTGAASVTAPTLSVKENEGSGQTISKWTISYSPVPEGGQTTVKYNEGKKWGDYVPASVQSRTWETEHTFNYSYYMDIMLYDENGNPVNCEVTTDNAGNKIIGEPWKTIYYEAPADNLTGRYEFDVNYYSLKPGKNTVVAYLYDGKAYSENVEQKNYAAYYSWVDEVNTIYDTYYKLLDEADKLRAEAKNDEAGAKDKEAAAKLEEYNKKLNEASEAYYEAYCYNYTGSLYSFNDPGKDVVMSDYYITGSTSSVTAEVDMEAAVSTIITTSSIKLTMSADGAYGYEVYRKIGSKYVKVGTVASRVYTDKGLDSNTTYSYKIRPYYVNDITKVTTYGKYTTIEAKTTGSALNLKAKLNSKNKVELTWSKVSGAAKYEVYRAEASSTGAAISKGDYDSFSSYKKIATVKKSKKKYKDTTVLANRNYSYRVVAVINKNKNIKNDKDYNIYATAAASTKFGRIKVINDYTNNKGERTISWARVYGAKGYLVEKYQQKEQPSKAYVEDSDKLYSYDGTYIYYKNSKGERINSYKQEQKADGTGTFLYSVYYTVNADGTKTENISDSNCYRIENGKAVIFDVEYKDNKPIYHTISYVWALGDTAEAEQGNVYKVDSVTGDITYTVYNDWVEYKKLGKGTTSVKLVPEVITDSNKNITIETTYRIRAYKDNTYSPWSESISSDVYKVTNRIGVVNKVTAKSVAGGIQVSWSAVTGAAYYKVYRVPTAAFVNNKDIDAYANQGNQIIEYVDAAAPVKVDVTSYNKEVQESIDAYNKAKADKDAEYEAALKAYNDNPAGKQAPKVDDYVIDRSLYLSESDKLNEKASYYYQNYSYKASVFTKTSIVDYYGDIYEGYGSKTRDIEINKETGALNKAAWKYTYNPIVSEDDVTKSSLKAGVSYTYFVVAYAADKMELSDYKPTYASLNYDYTNYSKWGAYPDDYYKEWRNKIPAYNKVTGAKVSSEYATAVDRQDDYNYKDIKGSTVGVKTVGTASYTLVTAPKKPALKSVKAAQGKVTIAIKKKIAGADYYKVYRSTKKKGTYVSVGVTKDAKTLKLVDSSVIKGKTYYYKVVAVKKNEANGDVESKASAIKKVRAK